MAKPLFALVLAEGKGERFRSGDDDISRVIFRKSLFRMALDAVLRLNPEGTCVVLAEFRQGLREEVSERRVEFVPRSNDSGASDPVQTVRKFLRSARGGDVLVIPADMPLIQTPMLRSLLAFHRKAGAPATVIGPIVEKPEGSGRVSRSGDTNARNAAVNPPGHRLRTGGEAGLFPSVFDAGEINRLFSLPEKNRDGRSALTLISRAIRDVGKRALEVPAGFADDFFRVRHPRDLARAAGVLRDRKIAELIRKGVVILDPRSTWVGPNVQVGRGSVLYPSVVLEGVTTIGRLCLIYPGAHLVNSRLGSRVTVFPATVMNGAVVENEVTVGPFARLRPKTILRAGSHVGNFVEMKHTDFGRGSKAGHLSYLGDSEIGKKVNIGAGTITCNYDGFKKNKTTIEDGAFIGSGTELVAPVRIGRGAYIAAGSAITRNVPSGALAFARSRQVDKPGWAKRRREARKIRGKE